MIETEFFEICELLCKTFPTTKMQDRVASLYHFFGKEEKEVIVRAVIDCCHSLDRFPVPKQFSQVIVTVKRGFKDRKKEVFECAYCESSGLIRAVHRQTSEKITFRCQCPNGLSYRGIGKWFGPDRSEFKREDEWQNVADDPMLHIKGLNYLKGLRNKGIQIPKIPDEIEKRIRGFAEKDKDVPF